MNNNLSIDVFIINFNGKNTILHTIESIKNNIEVNVNISVIDDHSNDNSPDLVRKCYPEIKIHIMPENSKRANVLRNYALKHAESEFVFITDNDINYDKACLSEMMKVITSDDKIASCTPRLMYWDKPEIVYMAGTRVHYIGAAISEQRDKPFNPDQLKPTLNSGSGICLLRREYALKVGSFDTELMQGWGSDGEFYQRLLRAGYKCLYVPKAFGLHEDKLQISARKFRFVGATYNRWVFILSHYSFFFLVLITPVLFIYELFQFSFATVKGLFKQYIMGNMLVVKNLRKILSKRRFVQNLTRVGDSKVLFAGILYVAPSLIAKHVIIRTAVKGLSTFLNSYWSVISKVIR